MLVWGTGTYLENYIPLFCPLSLLHSSQLILYWSPKILSVFVRPEGSREWLHVLLPAPLVPDLAVNLPTKVDTEETTQNRNLQRANITISNNWAIVKLLFTVETGWAGNSNGSCEKSTPIPETQSWERSDPKPTDPNTEHQPEPNCRQSGLKEMSPNTKYSRIWICSGFLDVAGRVMWKVSG